MRLAPLLTMLALAAPAPAAEFRWSHPGLLHNRQDLERMKDAVAAGRQPILSGYEKFRAHPQSQAGYTMRGPFEEIGRSPTVHFPEFDQDANAAYQNAIMWAITGDPAHARKSMEILNAWASTLKRVTGADAVLMGSLGPFKLVNAAEIIRYTGAGWSEADARQFERLCREVFYPVLKDFALFANGNWDTAAVKMVMAMGVFANDRAMYETALRYYVNGAGDGRLTHYIYENGECQESGRDQAHTQLGLAHLGDASEIAWHQGLDLYSAAGNRLLAGFEYTAKYNLGQDVPFVPDLDRTGKYAHSTISPRGPFRPVFEQIYNHYVSRMGLAAPFTAQAAEKVRPEGPAQSADHPGFGTLLFSRARAEDVWAGAPPAPAALIAETSGARVKLRWVRSRGAGSYTVKRATAEGGPYRVVATGLKAPEYEDSKVKRGVVYHYVVAAENSADSLEAAIGAGLPSPWAQADVGQAGTAGATSFDGHVFTLEGAGADMGGTGDQFQFAYLPMTGAGSITARFVPQVSSQSSKLGLVVRDGLAAGSPGAALLLAPVVSAGGRERPNWNAKLLVRAAADADATLAGSSPELPAPYVTWGRLMEPYWLRLERNGNTFTGSISADGRSWTKVAEAAIELTRRVYVGLAACSSIPQVTTTVNFDNVTASALPAAAPAHVQSPDGKVAIDFVLQGGGYPAYRIQYSGKPVVLESRLGFLPAFRSGFQLLRTGSDSHSGQWTNNFGERKTVPDNYCELTVDLKHESGKLLRLVFRAYNEGATLRYSFPAQKEKAFHFDGEQTEFRFPDDTYGYEEHGTEGEYRRVKVAGIQPWCERPLTLEYAGGIVASLAEAGNQRYPRMLLSGLADSPGALVSALGGETSNGLRGGRNDPHIAIAPGESTPWRVLVLGDRPGDLLERNYLILNLNPPSALKDTSWIRPGKAMRDTTLTTANAKAVVDFAETGGLQYVGFDARWYGTEDPEKGDATTIRVPDLDIKEVVAYARRKNVGVSLYVDRRQIRKQRDILFPLFEQWGVKAVKIGFVDVGPQDETAWMTETIAKAAEHHLVLDIHDGYRGTGNNRTYPNLLTVEGIRGNEHMPTPEHNATLPFTRYVMGLGDYTVCYLTPRKQTSFSHQLAMGVVSFSPMQWLYWYDKPSEFQGEPELEFFRHLPTVWDDTKVIHGSIGEYATIARRSGDEWFIGTINNRQPRTLRVPLRFLARGRKYLAHLYSDDDGAATRTKVGIAKRAVTAETTLEVRLKPAGGQAIWIEPAK